MLKVMIIDNDINRIKPLKQSLLESGFEVVAHVEDSINLQNICCQVEPDIVIIDTDSPSRDTIDNVCVLSQYNAKPIVMFTHDGNKEKIRAATKAGVSAYVVGNIASERLMPVIDAAIARFEETKQLKDELNLANLKLEERKVVERAKGILMRQRNLDEEQAYTMLRDMAMKRNMKISALSNQLIEAAKMLII
jgi:two-component system, response regulator / RNA-binding antiterminator